MNNEHNHMNATECHEADRAERIAKARAERALDELRDAVSAYDDADLDAAMAGALAALTLLQRFPHAQNRRLREVLEEIVKLHEDGEITTSGEYGEYAITEKARAALANTGA